MLPASVRAVICTFIFIVMVAIGLENAWVRRIEVCDVKREQRGLRRAQCRIQLDTVRSGGCEDVEVVGRYIERYIKAANIRITTRAPLIT